MQVAKIETEQFLAANMQNELKTKVFLGIPAFLFISELCGSSETSNRNCKSTGKGCYPVIGISMNHGGIMLLPKLNINISCDWKEALFRYKRAVSPQLHACGYEGRAGMHDHLNL